jgi:hypothetical protein
VRRRGAARSLGLASLACLATCVSACGSGTPVGGSYTVDFPTVADAIASDTVQVLVYPYSASNSCQTLIETYRTTLTAPSNFTSESQPVSACTLDKGSASLSLPLGEYSFLAVAENAGNDFMVGCAAQTLSDTNSVVDIPLTLSSETVSVPPTTCMTLSSFCAKQCK